MICSQILSTNILGQFHGTHASHANAVTVNQGSPYSRVSLNDVLMQIKVIHSKKENPFLDLKSIQDWNFKASLQATVVIFLLQMYFSNFELYIVSLLYLGIFQQESLFKPVNNNKMFSVFNAQSKGV